MEDSQDEKWRDAADRISTQLDADLILYSGSLLPPFDYELIHLVSGQGTKGG